MTIVVVDAAAQNLRSMRNALSKLGFEAQVADRPPDSLPEVVILPGVGAFGHVADILERRGWTAWLKGAVERGARLVGVCLGMQLFFESSEESPGAKGLGLFGGVVRRLKAPKVPHIGWAPVRPADGNSPALPWAYFAHGYVAEPSDPSIVSAWSASGEAFPSVVARGNVVGVQFHPEKSQGPGLDYLKFLVRGRS